jgi:hypothetical protein
MIQLAFSLLFFLLDVFFFGDFRKLDLKLPLRGSFTIHDGGTIIPLCKPTIKHENYVRIHDRFCTTAQNINLFIKLVKDFTDFVWCYELSQCSIKFKFTNLTPHPSTNTYNTHFYMALA